MVVMIPPCIYFADTIIRAICNEEVPRVVYCNALLKKEGCLNGRPAVAAVALNPVSGRSGRDVDTGLNSCAISLE